MQIFWLLDVFDDARAFYFNMRYKIEFTRLTRLRDCKQLNFFLESHLKQCVKNSTCNEATQQKSLKPFSEI